MNPKLKARWALSVARTDRQNALQRAEWVKSWDPDLAVYYLRIAEKCDDIIRHIEQQMAQP